MYSVTIVGAGKLATNLAHAVVAGGNTLQLILNRDVTKAKLLAGKYNTAWSDDLSRQIQSDFCVLAVSDDAIAQVLSKGNFGSSMVLHSSGSTSLDVFPPNILNCGVLYPFQTFSASHLCDFKNIPIFIEARDPKRLALLEDFARTMSPSVQQLLSNDRAVLHMTAVFACNYVNFMLVVAEKILKNNNLPQNALKHLVEETIHKVFTHGAEVSQTGPAIRNDLTTKEKHLQLLSNTNYGHLYEFLFNSIHDYYAE